MGFEPAMNNLANLLDDYAEPRRPKEAVNWYKRSLRRGHSVAAINLAMHYRNSGNRRWQIYWLKVAEKMGDQDAETELRKLK